MLRESLENVRTKAPMVHCITNYVTANDVANMILACGGKPIMADDSNEVEEITALSQGLNLNIGTLQQRTVASMLMAGRRANELKHPVLLDPVGVGASRWRMEMAANLVKEIRFDVIRGNMSEIKSLLGVGKGSGGVDALGADVVTEQNVEDAIAFAKEAAEKLGCVLAITGAIDLVTDGKSCYVLRGGRAEMSHVTGTGCQLSGMMTAFLAANPENMLQAAVSAVCVMNVAGEVAWEQLRPEEGNATYRNRIIDAVYRMDGELLERRANYEVR